MGFMKYNIDFEIIGSIIMLVIIIFFKLKFDRQTESEKCFIKLAYSVLAAQFLDMIKENDYDIVFLDHLMPEMDGIETLKKGIEEGILDPKVLPVVALTANAISGAREMFLSEGFTDYLSKPIVIKDFLALLIKYLPDEKIILNEDTEN